jgi:recombination protein RecA
VDVRFVFVLFYADRARLSLDEAIAKIDKAYGRGAVQKLSADAEAWPVISTGSIALDRAIGVGGLPRGRITEIYGPESSGKTTVALHSIANAQDAGLTAAFIDAEHALDPSYASALGVDTDELYVSQPDYGEQALEIVDALIQSSEVGIIVVDSVAALVPRAELEGDMGDARVGLHARLMSQAMRKLTGVTAKYGTALVFINQIRTNVGVMYGSPEVTTGGKALKFYSSLRLDVRRVEALKKGEENLGNRTRVKVVKNKLAPPFRVAEFDLLWGLGISREAELIELGVAAGLIKKSGNWYSIEETSMGNGKDNARAYLLENPDVADTLEARLGEK